MLQNLAGLNQLQYDLMPLFPHIFHHWQNIYGITFVVLPASDAVSY